MTATDVDGTDPAPAPSAASRADRIAHLMIGAAAMLHSIGGHILRTRNEQLTTDLADARKATSDAAGAAYELGRQHERDGSSLTLAGLVGAPAAAPPAAAANVDEHQVHEPAADPA